MIKTEPSVLQIYTSPMIIDHYLVFMEFIEKGIKGRGHKF